MSVKYKIQGQFAPWPRELLESKAWAAASIHVRRLIDFLEREHLRHGGQENGLLTAPRRQLCAFGIHPRSISAAIEDGVKLGLIDVCRGARRRPSTYTLTWLPVHDGTPPSERFTECDAAADAIIEAAKRAKRRPSSWPPGRPGRTGNGHTTGTQNFGDTTGTQTQVPNGTQSTFNGDTNGTQSPLDEGYTNGTPYLEEALPRAGQDKNGAMEVSPVDDLDPDQDGAGLSGASASAAPGNDNRGEIAETALGMSHRCRWYVTNDYGYRLCGKPVVSGEEHCVAHALQASARERGYRQRLG